MSWETLTYDKPEPGIGVVTFNRPRRANAISQHMLKELEDVCRVVTADDDVRCVVVTGAGNAFSAGFDLRDQADAMPSGVADWVPLLEADFKGIMSFWNLPKPSVAAVNGPASRTTVAIGCLTGPDATSAAFDASASFFCSGVWAKIAVLYDSPRSQN